MRIQFIVLVIIVHATLPPVPQLRLLQRSLLAVIFQNLASAL